MGMDTYVQLLNLHLWATNQTSPSIRLFILTPAVIIQHTSLKGGKESLHVPTVKPPNRGHFGDGPFVPCREVVLFSEVLF